MPPEYAIPFRDFVVDMIGAACNVDPSGIDLQTPMLDLGLDSLSLFAVVSQVEASYGIDLMSDGAIDLFAATCVADLLAAMEARLATPTPTPISPA